MSNLLLTEHCIILVSSPQAMNDSKPDGSWPSSTSAKDPDSPLDMEVDQNFENAFVAEVPPKSDLANGQGNNTLTKVPAGPDLSQVFCSGVTEARVKYNVELKEVQVSLKRVNVEEENEQLRKRFRLGEWN
jgi:hypothetical protein